MPERRVEECLSNHDDINFNKNHLPFLANPRTFQGKVFRSRPNEIFKHETRECVFVGTILN